LDLAGVTTWLPPDITMESGAADVEADGLSSPIEGT
jgi:hypothetical protein